jgi:hypothetical protein
LIEAGVVRISGRFDRVEEGRRRGELDRDCHLVGSRTGAVLFSANTPSAVHSVLIDSPDCSEPR